MIVYLRCRRVSSTQTQSLLSWICKEEGLTYHQSGDHKCASKWRDSIGFDNFNQATKITTIRSPFTNLVSIYLQYQDLPSHGFRYKIPESALKEFIPGFRDKMREIAERKQHYNTLPRHEQRGADWDWFIDRNWNIYTIDDNIVADQLLMYEKPLESWINLLENLSIDHNKYTNRLEQFSRDSITASQRYDYRIFYDDKTIEYVNIIRSREIKQFGYTFDQ